MAADIVEVIGDHTRLKKAGRSWKGLCPFHNERTPSFTVDRDKGLYHCFGCGAGGDVIHFVRQIDRLEFPEAVEALAGRFGVTIPRRERRGPRDDRRDKLFEAVAAAERFYRGTPRQARQRRGDVSRRARSSEGALAGADARPRPRRLGLDRPSALPRLSRKPAGRGGPAPAPPGGQGRVRPFPRPAAFRGPRRARPRGGIRRARPLARGRAQVPELARVADLLEEAAPLRSLPGARGDPPARPRRARRGVLRPHGAPARRRRRDGRLDGNRPDARAGGAAAPADAATRSSATTETPRAATPRAAPWPSCSGRGSKPGSRGFLRARIPTTCFVDRGRRPSPARIDEAPDFLTWLLEDVQPDAAGLTPTEKRERMARILEILAAIPDRILRYEEYRKVSAAVSVPVDVLWGADKANLQPSITRSKSVGDMSPATPGTPGNAGALSAVVLPGAEKQLLQALTAGGELNSLILSTLNHGSPHRRQGSEGGLRPPEGGFRVGSC